MDTLVCNTDQNDIVQLWKLTVGSLSTIQTRNDGSCEIRWYAVEHPIRPPPTMTTSCSVGMSVARQRLRVATRCLQIGCLFKQRNITWASFCKTRIDYTYIIYQQSTGTAKQLHSPYNLVHCSILALKLCIITRLTTHNRIRIFSRRTSCKGLFTRCLIYRISDLHNHLLQLVIT